MKKVPAAALLVTAFAAAACGRRADSAPGQMLVDDDRPAPIQVVGVSPLDFRCDMVAPLPAVAQAVGVAVEPVEAGFDPPAGVPRPCTYHSTEAGKPGTWSFDLDCRLHALDEGARLMASFATDPTAVPVLVGRSGLDHHGVQLLFIDDDTPCYVRVMGAGAPERLALARLVAGNLEPRNAPGRVSYSK